jgi:2-haloacid dehalogenase
MSVTIGYDVYGTLIDTRRIVDTLETRLGDKSEAFARVWRQKQLEYSFRRGLMQNYERFFVCATDALEYACTYTGVYLSDEEKLELMNMYRILPAFADADGGLQRAREAGFRLFAFSNGSLEVLEELLTNAGLRDYFIDLVSAEEIKTFKPNPGVYSHFLRRAGAPGSEAWLVSSNPFDVIGGVSAGMNAAWVRRSSDTIFDPWGIEPTITVNDLYDLPGEIRARNT